MRGRFGGVYFKTGPDGKHIQAMPRVWRYTRSPAQQGKWETRSPFLGFGMDAWTGASAIWMMALLAFWGAAWATFALIYYFTREPGDEKHITGYNWFMHYAMRFPEAERPPFWQPPHAPNDLPSFIALYKGMWTYEHDPLEWPADACTGYYWPSIPWNDKLSYKTDDFNWHIWWKDPMWVVSPGPGFEPEALTFYSSGAEIVDYYRNPVTKKWTHVYFGNPDERLLPH